MPNPKDKLMSADLFSIRCSEMLAVLMGIQPMDTYPEWVINLGKKLFFDYFPKDTPIPGEAERFHFGWGVLIGTHSTDAEVVSFRNKLAKKASAIKSPLAPLIPEIRRQISETGTEVGLFSEKHRADILDDFFNLDPERRVAFATGLLLGAKAFRELQEGSFGRSGGSYRRHVWLALWLNWPAVNEEKSVPSVYAMLERLFDEAGKHYLLGSFYRFKMLASAIGLRPRRRKIDKPKAN